MPAAKSRFHWTDDERAALTHAYDTADTADQFFAIYYGQVPGAPRRTTKAYLSELLREKLKDVARGDRRLVYIDLIRVNRDEEIAEREAEIKAKATAPVQGTLLLPVEPPPGPVFPAPVNPPVPDKTGTWVDDIDSAPLPPNTPPVPARPPNFVKPRPDPNAPAPRYFSPPANYNTRRTFNLADIANTFNLDVNRVVDVFTCGHLPMVGMGEVSHAVFSALYNAMCDGHDFDTACRMVREVKEPQVETIVSAEDLYTPDKLEVKPDVTFMDAIKNATPEQISTAIAQVKNPPPPGGDVHQYKPEVVVRLSAPKATGCNQKLFALEALRDGILDLGTTLGLLGPVADQERARWALGLLHAGKITVEQATKLIK